MYRFVFFLCRTVFFLCRTEGILSRLQRLRRLGQNSPRAAIRSPESTTTNRNHPSPIPRLEAPGHPAAEPLAPTPPDLAAASRRRQPQTSMMRLRLFLSLGRWPSLQSICSGIGADRRGSAGIWVAATGGSLAATKQGEKSSSKQGRRASSLYGKHRPQQPHRSNRLGSPFPCPALEHCSSVDPLPLETPCSPSLCSSFPVSTYRC
jgi:hypothetical protein